MISRLLPIFSVLFSHPSFPQLLNIFSVFYQRAHWVSCSCRTDGTALGFALGNGQTRLLCSSPLASVSQVAKDSDAAAIARQPGQDRALAKSPGAEAVLGQHGWALTQHPPASGTRPKCQWPPWSRSPGVRNLAKGGRENEEHNRTRLTSSPRRA